MCFKKYFIALVIPEPGFSEIESMKNSLYSEHGLKGALRSPAHLTLHRPFIWKEEKEQILIDHLTQFRFNKSIHIQLKNYSFFEPRVIYIDVLPNEALNKLHAELTLFAKTKLKLLNEAEDMRGFYPHVTIAFRDLKKAMFYTLQKEYSKQAYAFDFQVSQITLLKHEKTWEIFKTFDGEDE